MKINGVELPDLDLMGLDAAETLEKALEKVENISGDIVGLKTSEVIRIQCTAIFDFFNTLFGKGTDKKIFGDKVNLLSCLKAFEELMVQIGEKNAEAESFVNKYSPNRAKRRKKK